MKNLCKAVFFIASVTVIASVVVAETPEMAYAKACHSNAKKFYKEILPPELHGRINELDNKFIKVCSCQAIELADNGLQEEMLQFPSLHMDRIMKEERSVWAKINGIVNSPEVEAKCGTIVELNQPQASLDKPMSQSQQPEVAAPTVTVGVMTYQFDKEAIQKQIVYEQQKQKSIFLERYENADKLYQEKLAKARAFVQKQDDLKDDERTVLVPMLAATLFHGYVQCCRGMFMVSNQDIAAMEQVIGTRGKATETSNAIRTFLEENGESGGMGKLYSLKVEAMKARSRSLYGDESVKHWQLPLEKLQATMEQRWSVRY